MALAVDLKGKVGLVLGIANEQSIAFGCAQALQQAGAALCVTYLNDKARSHVEPLAQRLQAELLLPCDVRQPGQLEAVFAAMAEHWGKLDFVVHSIAWSPLDELHGRLLDSTAEGFAQAMDVSCHSFVRAARLAEPLMQQAGGGTLLTMSYYGADKVVAHYNLMGPVKAALESASRYLAAELGSSGIRVHALSPGPMPTRAASGIEQFDQLLDKGRHHSPLQCLGTPEDVGHLAAFLVSDLGAHLTGSTLFVDAGLNIMS
ncbi:enoyl-[acyl-carrier-protein] reductase FabI [Pokkaliibacter plantistimulans]|uniref:Enoyl-[acyl-carrier-protein] reductase [NADH] n=1 Tax=Proteobacteria bacterium 228 TaxID=2083153 RepID=A0A2S5KSE1_9PROT|nr:enoyl-ACP reductase FabI [Pokkaliibacter plantistimulans]PPC77650.1 enoyl-[acyl-carrier-protein] reductase FabI [Pokkaliibacter plantistimulans]